jgi:hypothetical protein
VAGSSTQRRNQFSKCGPAHTFFLPPSRKARDTALLALCLALSLSHRPSNFTQISFSSLSPTAGLAALASALEARHLVRNMQLVLKARVPIIKFEMIDSGLAFDVSWEVRF